MMNEKNLVPKEFDSQPPKEPVSLNNYFDNIYLINLDRQPERLETISKKLEKYGIVYEKFSAIDGREIPDSQYDFSDHEPGYGLSNKYVLATTMSHIEVIKKAKQNKHKNILVLEDDVMFCENFNERLQILHDIKSWKMLYLGASQYDWKNIKHLDNFYQPLSVKCLGCYGAFAYGVDCSLYDEIISNMDYKRVIDRIYCELHEKYAKDCYICYPNLCIADVTSSSLRAKRDQNSHNIKMRWNLLNYE